MVEMEPIFTITNIIITMNHTTTTVTYEPRFIKLRNFTVIEEMNGSALMIDYPNKVVKIEWNGVIDLATARTLFNATANAIEHDLADKALLNRKNFREFTTEARIWIKHEFIQSRSTRWARKLMKLATVNSTSQIGNVFSNFINRGMQVIFPGVQLSKFDTELDAENWLIGK